MSNFKLQNVLNYRKHVEELLIYELSQKEAALATEINCLRQKEKEKAKLGKQMEAQMERGLTSYQCSLFFMAIKRFEASIHYHKQRIAILEQEIDDAKQSVIDASKDTKTMKKLKDKYTSHQRYTDERLETSLLDEFSTNHYIRNTGY